MTGNSAILHHIGNVSLRYFMTPAVIISAKPKVPNDFPAILSSSSHKGKVCQSVRESRDAEDAP